MDNIRTIDNDVICIDNVELYYNEKDKTIVSYLPNMEFTNNDIVHSAFSIGIIIYEEYRSYEINN